MVENIVPVVIELKHMLESRHSPLLKYVLTYLKEVMSDYQEELADMLVCDPQLAKEIEYDLRQHTKEQKSQIATPGGSVLPFSLTPNPKRVTYLLH